MASIGQRLSFHCAWLPRFLSEYSNIYVRCARHSYACANICASPGLPYRIHVECTAHQRRTHGPCCAMAMSPFLLSPISFMALHSTTRRVVPARLNPRSCLMALACKLRLPTLGPSAALLNGVPPTCLCCNSQVDFYGHHFFACKYRKTKIHDLILDSVHIITKMG